MTPVTFLHSDKQTKCQTGPDTAPEPLDDGLSYLGPLTSGTLNELQPTSYRDRVAALGAIAAFLSSMLADTSAPVIWCQLRDPDRLHLHAPGLMAFGLDPARIIKLTVTSEKDLLWVLEEAITSGTVGAAVGVLWSERLYDFTASKRLRLRASEAGTPVFMVRSHRANGATAADMRFSVTSQASQMPSLKERPFARLGAPTWQLNLIKSKRVKPRSDTVRWNHETLRLGMATELGRRLPQSQNTPAIPLQNTG